MSIFEIEKKKNFFNKERLYKSTYIFIYQEINPWSQEGGEHT